MWQQDVTAVINERIHKQHCLQMPAMEQQAAILIAYTRLRRLSNFPNMPKHTQ
jgi:hypothetical protein